MCPEENRENQVPGEEQEIVQSNAARVLQARGQDREEETAAPVKGNWFANFWYHHKWKVIVIGAFAFIFITLGAQFAGKSNPDIKILYAGPSYITPNQSLAFRQCIAGLMEDYNGDGEIKISMNDMVYLTAEQLKEEQARCEALGETFTVNRQANAQTAEQFTYEIMAGDAMLCFLAEQQYLEVASVEAFVPLEEVFGTVPQGAIDDCGIRLCETNLWEYYSQMQIFTEDTVVALRKLTTFNKMKGEDRMEEMHDWYMDVFYKIGTFAFPEGYVPETDAAM